MIIGLLIGVLALWLASEVVLLMLLLKSLYGPRCPGGYGYGAGKAPRPKRKGTKEKPNFYKRG